MPEASVVPGPDFLKLLDNSFVLNMGVILINACILYPIGNNFSVLLYALYLLL